MVHPIAPDFGSSKSELRALALSRRAALSEEARVSGSAAATPAQKP